MIKSEIKYKLNEKRKYIVQWIANPEQFENFPWWIIAVFHLHKRIEKHDSKLTTSLCKRNTAIIR